MADTRITTLINIPSEEVIPRSEVESDYVP